MGLAVVYTLHDYEINGKLKWPNDVIVNDRKICGILGENFENKLIFGVGLNIYLDESIKRTIDRPAIAINDIKECPDDRLSYLVKIINYFNQFLFEFKSGKNFIKEFDKYGYRINENVQFDTGNSILSGKIKTINEYGFLIFETDEGDIVELSNGEIVF